MNSAPITLPKKSGETRWIGNVQHAAKGLTMSQAAIQHGGLTLVIAKDSNTANLLENEIRFFTKDQLDILSFPDWETLPYDGFSPHQDIISTRISTLQRLTTLQKGIVIVPVNTLMHRIVPADFLKAHSLVLEKEQKVDLDVFRKELTSAGYQSVETVFGHGEFAVRGSIIDLFPMGSDLPYRIELLDDEIDTLRTFDSESQKSIEQVDSIRLLPGREIPLSAEAITLFKQNWRDAFDVDHRNCPIYQDVHNGFAPAGIEYYLPFFFQSTSTLFDYLHPDSLIIIDNALQEPINYFWQDAKTRYEDHRHDIQRPILSPNEIFITDNEFFGQIKPFRRLQLNDEPFDDKAAGKTNLDCSEIPDLGVNAQAAKPLLNLDVFLQNHSKEPILFCAESAGRREALLELLAKINIKPRLVDSWSEFQESRETICLATYPLERGASFAGQFHIISESLLFGRRVFQRRRRSKEKDQSELVVRNLTELAIGAPVVHLDHGVGRFLGLETIELDGQPNEFLTLSYANDAKLYVPVSSLHLISRYSGTTDELAPLHRLGTEQWSKAKQKATEKIRDTAAELLDIYARRAARKGFRFNQPDELYEMFSAGFPFEETPDQDTAIKSVLRDMISAQPMDRLVCGDVGFGKTEVAMRAAFMAVQSSRQVAILVPTTLLAQQHYENFRDRFADWPVTVELTSRFRTAKQQNTVIEQLNNGKIDIIVGTHKLLQSDVQFKNLGLIIIDEEHRFGVQQKERLKSLRSEVDILTMTATPIPRTLNMAMSGMRDLSIIATPPARRLAVKTFVRESDTKLIKEAILRELLRGGQVYYLHNEVKSIEKVGEELAALVPEARIGIGHGQMRERELEQVMSDFYHKRHNVLLCTTIVETGIDVPNANTIIIDRADKFGLAQLHQLRGRVGRSHHQAYAYLLTPPPKNISSDAKKRLEAIAQAEDLGAGFTLATHDLEIRGAGELLGKEQSGQMQGIGFTLYMEMLEEAIQSIKEGKTPNMDKPLNHGSEINLRIPALIPDDYLPDVHNRLIMYKRISSAKNETELKELQIEMIDRFGMLPETVKNLFRQTSIKLSADTLGIVKIDASVSGGKMEFDSDTKIEPFTLVTLVQKQPQNYKLDGATQLRFSLSMESTEDRFVAVENLLNDLSKVHS